MSLERLLWLFTRVSAVLMAALALAALCAALSLGARTEMGLDALLRWTFQPLPDHVVTSGVDVEQGWWNPAWRMAAVGMLWVAGAHGFNGARSTLEEYVHSRVGRWLVRLVLGAAGCGVGAAGAYLILTS